MAITATITNISKINDAIQVFVSFDDGTQKIYIQPSDVTRATIRGAIKSDVDYKNSVDQKVSNLADMIGNVIN